MIYKGVAISGRAGSGKSTLAGRLRDQYVPTATITPFAYFLKEEVKELYGLVKGDPGSREAMLEHGARRRAEDIDYWLKRTGDWIDQVLADGGFPIVDDLRYPNEYEFCRSRGFLLVRVEARLETRMGRLASQGLDPNFALSSTMSETALEQHGFHLRLMHDTLTERQAAMQTVASRTGLLSDRYEWHRNARHRVPDAAA